MWECDQRRNKSACKAKLHVLDDQVIKQVNDHTHVASRAVAESSKVRQEMKKRARETEETPQQIISQSAELLSEQAAVAMPPFHKLELAINQNLNVVAIKTETDEQRISSKTTTTGTDCSISGVSPTTSVCEETVFFKKTPNYRLHATQNGSLKNHQPTMRLCQPCTTL